MEKTRAGLQGRHHHPDPSVLWIMRPTVTENAFLDTPLPSLVPHFVASENAYDGRTINARSKQNMRPWCILRKDMAFV